MASIFSLLCYLLMFLCSNTTLLAAGEANKTEIDRQSLLCFKSGIYSDPLRILNSWRNTSLNFCRWSGVTCGTGLPNRVVSLDLASAHLDGQISSCIAKLTSISQINLTDNHLSGAIPGELGKLAGLQTLMLAVNRLEGSFNLMACLKEIPILKGNNYTEWRKKIEFSFVCGEVDWVLTTPQPQAPQKPVRADGDDDAAWQQKERDYAPLELAYTLENKQWTTANKKCMALVKNTIEPAILGSIAECDSVSEYLDKIRNQFTGSSKIYATQLFKQLATERYNGGGTGIRDHIMRMYNLAAQLKPMDLELKPGHIMHLVFASLPKEFDTFVVNYNMQPEQWDMEKMIAMCVQEEDRLRSSHGGSLHYVKDNRKKIANPSFKARGKAPMQQNHQKLLPVDKDQCLHCKKKGHFKKDCPDWLKSIMAKRGIPFDEDYAKKRKMR
ncbi:uncharacterized protein [Setaria viridis]|uniref:uncharacterized protein isoform X1 n=1 Tax=Setaria viridis TaxID=4556 RepID=UPI003B3AC4D0